MKQSGLTDKIALLRQAIAAQERLRETLGDEVVDAAVAGLRRQLARFDDAQRQQVSEEQIRAREAPPAAPPARVVERRRATLMCARFLLPEGAAPRPDQRAALRQFVEAVIPLLHARGGHTQGDETADLVACFASRGARSDHADVALAAALDLLENAARFALAGDHHFQVGIGLRDGLLMGFAEGEGGDDAVRRVPHAGSLADAKALAQRAGPGTILVDEAVHRVARTSRSFESCGLMRLPETSRPVSVWELIHRGRGSGRLGRLAVAPLVGRQVEWARLQAASRHVSSGRGSVCWIQGEAGIGKTRLIREARADLAGTDWLWLEVSCHESDRLRPHAVVRCIMRSWLGRAAAGSRAWQALCETVAELGHEDEMPVWQPALATLAGLRVPDELQELLAHLDGQGVATLGLFGLTVLLERAMAERPVVLVVDDLHMADETSIVLLQHLVTAVDRGALWLILSTEEDDAPEIARLRRHARRATRYHALDPQPLAHEDAVKMAHGLLGLAELPARLEGVLLDCAGGHPFTLETACLSLVDCGAVLRDPATLASTLTQAAWQVTLPATLSELVLDRMVHLDVIEREIVEMLCAHCGDLDAPSLQVLGVSARDAQEALRSLRRRRLVRVDDEGHVSLAHDLLQRHLYVSLTIRQRRGLHLSWARAMRPAQDDKTGGDPTLLAWQFARGGDWEQAAIYLQQAAERARRQGGAAEFIACVEMLRETAGRPREGATSLQRGAEQDRQLGDAWLWRGRPGEASQAYARALEQLGAELPDPDQSSALVRTSQKLRVGGQRLLAGMWRRTERRTTGRGVGQVSMAMAGLARALGRSQPRRGAAAWRALRVHGERAGDHLALARAGLGLWLQAEQRRRGGEAGEHLNRARRAAEALGRPLVSAQVDLGAAWHAACAGDREAAQAYSGRGAEVAWACGDLRLFGRLRALTGWMLYHGGRLDAALRVFEDLEEVALRAGDPAGTSHARLGRALVTRRVEGPEAAAPPLAAAVQAAGDAHVAASTLALAEAWLTQTRLGEDRTPAPVLKRLPGLRLLSHGRLAADHATLAMCDGILLAAERAGSSGRALALEEVERLLAEVEVSATPHPLRADALRLQGCVLALRGRHDKALRTMKAAVEAADDAEARLMQADALVELARLQRDDTALHAAMHTYEQAGARACLAAARLRTRRSATS